MGKEDEHVHRNACKGKYRPRKKQSAHSSRGAHKYRTAAEKSDNYVTNALSPFHVAVREPRTVSVSHAKAKTITLTVNIGKYPMNLHEA